ncbi:hypothetical protein Pmani_023028 [Petrolisthes manimaculis]|uniref:CCHC-type domain-containing protein n=1 Tax=Petrolisthes manimaculis TaxID=1843537 RepID=A0AAE1PBK5_9EUCA|nr:hypothetical protein Pmani_023028 [Petrolisthes manimaculis]
MVRFARAEGSKGSNKRVLEDATPWSEMVAQMPQDTTTSTTTPKDASIPRDSSTEGGHGNDSNSKKKRKKKDGTCTEEKKKKKTKVEVNEMVELVEGNVREEDDDDDEMNQSEPSAEVTETDNKKKKKKKKKNKEKVNCPPSVGFVVNNEGQRVKVFKDGKERTWFDLPYEENDRMTRYANMWVKRERVDKLDQLKESLKEQNLGPKETMRAMMKAKRKAHQELRIELIYEQKKLVKEQQGKDGNEDDNNQSQPTPKGGKTQKKKQGSGKTTTPKVRPPMDAQSGGQDNRNRDLYQRTEANQRNVHTIFRDSDSDSESIPEVTSTENAELSTGRETNEKVMICKSTEAEQTNVQAGCSDSDSDSESSTEVSSTKNGELSTGIETNEKTKIFKNTEANQRTVHTKCRDSDSESELDTGVTSTEIPEHSTSKETNVKPMMCKTTETNVRPKMCKTTETNQGNVHTVFRDSDSEGEINTGVTSTKDAEFSTGKETNEKPMIHNNEQQNLKSQTEAKTSYNTYNESFTRDKKRWPPFHFEENEVMTQYDGFWVKWYAVDILDKIKKEKTNAILSARGDVPMEQEMSSDELLLLRRAMKKEKRREHNILINYLRKQRRGGWRYGNNEDERMTDGNDYLRKQRGGLSRQENNEEERTSDGNDEIVKFDGSLLKMETVKRLKKLREKMLSVGVSEEEVNNTIKRERRKEERALKNERNRVCLQCRQPGHLVSECPQGGKELICYLCGSTEHKSRECTAKSKDNFVHATCFECGESGHIVRQCPNNPRGLYPNGGACRECGSVEHLARDCPDKMKVNEEETIKAERLDKTKVDALDCEPLSQPDISPGKKNSKVIKF